MDLLVFIICYSLASAAYAAVAGLLVCTYERFRG